MRFRTLATMFLAVPLIFGTVACGDDEKAADDTTELKSDGGSSADDDSSNDSSSNDSSSNDSSSNDTGDIDESIDDLAAGIDELGDIDMGDLGDCMTIGLTYATLGLSVLGGEDAAKEAIAELDDMASKLPEDLRDDLAVVADAFTEVAEKGMIDGSDALETDEYKKADENVTKYLEEKCGG